MSRLGLDARLADLTSMSSAELRTVWEQAYAMPCPRLTPALLRLAIAYRFQEKKHGGLPAAALRALERAARGGDAVAPPPTVTLRPGAQLVRTWQGRTIRVEVVEDGYLWEGRRHASLSSIARAVTGAHWSGPRFFGLTGAARG